MATKAGGAYVELFLKDSPLVSGLAGAQKKLAAWGTAISGAGTRLLGMASLGLGAFAGFAKIFASTGDQLQKMSLRTGTSVEALSQLQFAASQSGTDIESLETGLRKMQRTMADAASGEKTAADALAKVGLSAKDLMGLGPDAQLAAIADRIAAIRDPALRTAAAVEIFGRGGAALLPMMAQGAAGIAALRQEADRLGLTMSQEAADDAAALEDAMDKLWRSLKRTAAIIGGTLAPILTGTATAIANAAKPVMDWIREHEKMFQTALAVTAGLAVAGVGLIAFGKLFSLAAGGIGALLLPLKIIGSIAGLVFGPLMTILGALLSPIGLVVLAVGGIGAAFLTMSGTTGAVIDWLKGAFSTLSTDVTDAMGAIGHAMAAGDMAAAAAVLWTTIKLEWQRGVGFINKLWAGVTKFFMDIWDDVVSWFGELWVDPIGTLERTWIKAVAAMKMAWNDLSAAIQSTWRSMYTGIAGWMTQMLEKSGAISAETSQFMQEDVLRQAAVYEKPASEAHAARAAEILDEETTGLAAAEPTDPETKAKLETIRAKHKQAETARDKNYDDAIAAADAAVTAAKTERDEALGKARAATKKPPAENPWKQPAAPLGNADLTGARMQTMGSFSATGVRGLGLSGSVLDRIARAGEQTERNTRPIGAMGVGMGFA